MTQHKNPRRFQSREASFKVALVGRPNVGKSTLFNRLTGKRLALVNDQPGVTRDRRYGLAHLKSLHFELIDTAGLADPDQSALTESMYAQTLKAIAEADIVCLMTDGQVSCTPYDMDIAHMLRACEKPVCVLANKVESTTKTYLLEGVVDANQLGIHPILPISAEHGIGMDDLYQFLKGSLKHITLGSAQNNQDDASLPLEGAWASAPAHHPIEDNQGMGEAEFTPQEEKDEEHPLRLSVMGRPNVGKSTLINALLGEERQLAGDMPGLTRDAIRIPFFYQDRAIQLIDTAGIRRTARIDNTLEHLSVNDARKALQFSEVVILVIDCTQALEKQDLSLAYDIYNEGRAMVIALNKWDKVEVRARTSFLEEVQHKLYHQLAQAKKIPFIPVTATQGKGLDALMAAVFEMSAMWNKRVPTAKLNAWLEDVVSYHPAPAVNGRRIRPKYITQAKSRPPTFVLFCTQAAKLPESYTRYLSNSLREHFNIQGVPIRFWVRAQKNPYTDGKTRRTKRT